MAARPTTSCATRWLRWAWASCAWSSADTRSKTSSGRTVRNPMAESSNAAQRQAAGSIYDLGYRSYEGRRLGRSYAFTSLFMYSFLSVWGIGRSFWAKFFPFALAVIVMLPSIILLAIAALLPAE